MIIPAHLFIESTMMMDHTVHCAMIRTIPSLDVVLRAITMTTYLENNMA